MITRRTRQGVVWVATLPEALASQNPCRADYNRRMSRPNPVVKTPPLRGWRARLWAWVLFVALFKGLVPHAALASVMMDGSPALLWCAPGTPGQAEAGGAKMAAAHDCVCASSGDGALPLPGSAIPAAEAGQSQGLTRQPPWIAAAQWRLPPARGPPSV